MKFILSILMAALMLASPVFAQDDDKGFIAGLLESSLAGEGRTVQINGFRGALSRQATVSSIVILDNEGEWLRMDNLALQLNRRALLRGRVEVEELSAEMINLSRLPIAPDSDLPPAEAQGFSLPELPVSIDIKRLRAEKIILGAPVLGEPTELSLTAALSLIDGEALVKLSADRIDGKRGNFEIDAGFKDQEQIVDLNIRLDEGEGGIAARLLGLPGNPSTKLSVAGSGPLNDLSTDINIATDGEDRLNGKITLMADAPASAGATVSRSFKANISGDVTALFAPQYRPFFGNNVSLIVDGQRAANGALDISNLDLATAALGLSGSVTLNRDYWPTKLNLKGRIANDAATLVTLPISGAKTKLREAILDVQFDSDQGNALTGVFEVTELERDGIAIAKTDLTAKGILDGKVNAIGAVSADIDMNISGIALDDPALMRAVGDEITGRLTVDFVEGLPFKLSGLNVSGSDFTLTGAAEIADLAAGLDTSFDTRLVASNISRFSDIAGSKLNGAVAIDLKGSADLGGEFDIELSGDIDDLKIGQDVADKLLRGQTDVTLKASRNAVGTRIETVSISNPQLSLSGNGLLTGDGADVTFETKLNETSELADVLEGPATVAGTATQRNGEWSVDVDASGPFMATAQIDGLVTGPNARVKFSTSLPDIKPFVPDYTGAVTIGGEAFVSPAGWNVDTTIAGPYGLNALVDGLVTGPNINVNFDATLPDISPFVPNYSGAVNVAGKALKSPDGWNVDTALKGPYGLNALVDGLVTGPNASVNFDATLPDIAPFAPGYRGAVNVAGKAFQSPDGWNVETSTKGPYGLTSFVDGLVTGQNARVNFKANLPDINPLVPQYRGALSVSGTAQNSVKGWGVETALNGPYGLTAKVGGRVTGEAAPDVTFTANLPNVAPIVPKISGPLSLNGDVQQVTDVRWNVGVDVKGPAGTAATVSGAVNPNGRLNLSVIGNAPLALANPFLTPRSVSGDVRFSLRVQGPPDVSSVSGTVNISNGRAVAPNLQFGLQNMSADVSLSSGRANLDMNTQVSSGGTLRVTGPLGLTGTMPANLNVVLNGVVLEDPTLYKTTIDGTIGVDGPLLSNARISGRLDVGETEISIPSSGVSSFGTIPNITHINPTSAVQSTRVKAGLVETEGGKSSGGNGYPLDITVSAPQRIFVRGRGLDAELGGQLRLTGTTANIISAGRFELQRGRLDILSKRFALDEGIIQLQGDFNPFLRFVAITNTTVGTASVVVEGLATDPQVRFESSPESPQDEVLAQIFFGRDVSQITALQALQLASAVATLAGKGGEGIVSKLRRGFALDDLDITTDEQGNAGLRAGKYISDNIYTDVTVGTQNNAEVSLNIDITPNITATGKLGTDGDTSIGIYFLKDY